MSAEYDQADLAVAVLLGFIGGVFLVVGLLWVVLA